MFHLSHPALPTNPRSETHDGALVGTLTLPTAKTSALLAIAGLKDNDSITLQLPDFTGDTAEVDVTGLDLGEVDAVEIASLRYVRNATPKLAPGQFFFNPYTQSITLKFP